MHTLEDLFAITTQDLIGKICNDYYAMYLFNTEEEKVYPVKLSKELTMEPGRTYPPTESYLCGRLTDSIEPQYRAAVYEFFSLASLRSLSENDRRELMYLQTGGRWIKAVLLPVKVKAGKTTVVLATLRDITESRMQLNEVSEEKRIETNRADNYYRLFLAAAEEMYVSIIKINIATGKANRLFLDQGSIVERSLEGGLKTLYNDFLESIHPDDKEAILKKTAYGHLEKLPLDRKVEYTYRRKNKLGQYKWYSTFLRLDYDYYGKLTATVFTVDINEEIMERARLKDLSEHDALSYLFNRTKLEHMKNTEYQTLSSCGVLFFDINNLKDVNDTQGHGAGDELICQVADSIRSITNRNIHAYRLGGDEFIVIICDAPKSAMENLVHMWQARLQELADMTGRKCSVAVGAAWSQAPVVVQELIEEADKAMYVKKRLMKSELSNKAEDKS